MPCMLSLFHVYEIDIQKISIQISKTLIVVPLKMSTSFSSPFSFSQLATKSSVWLANLSIETCTSSFTVSHLQTTANANTRVMPGRNTIPSPRKKLPTTISGPRAKITCKFPGVSRGGEGMGNDRIDSCIKRFPIY